MTGRGAAARRAALVGTMLGGAACKSQPVTAAASSAVLPDSAEQVMSGLRHLATSAGVRRAQLVSDTAYFYEEGNRIELRTVRIVFFGAAGDSSSVLTSRTGRFDVRQKRMEGRGNVVVTSVDGRRLTSPHLTYDQFTNQITSDTSFTFTEPGRTISGVGLRTDPQLRNVQVLGRLGARTQVNETTAPRRPAPTAAPSSPPAAPTTTPAATTPAAPPTSPARAPAAAASAAGARP